MDQVLNWWRGQYPAVRGREGRSAQSQSLAHTGPDDTYGDESQGWTPVAESAGSEERLIYNPDSDCWTYERRTHTAQEEAFIHSTLANGNESGEIRSVYPDCRVIEEWSRGESFRYKKTTVTETGNLEVTADLQDLDPPIGSVEVKYVAGEVEEYEKVVYSGDGRRGEVLHRYGARQWGETWKREKGGEETQQWRLDSGERPDTDISERFAQHWAAITNTEPPKQENPIPVISLEPIIQREAETVQESLSTLELMIDSVPELSGEYAAIAESYEEVGQHSLGDISAQVERLTQLQVILQQIEKVKRKAGKSFREWVEKGRQAQEDLRDLSHFSLETLQLTQPSAAFLPSLEAAYSDLSTSTLPCTLNSWSALLKRLFDSSLPTTVQPAPSLDIDSGLATAVGLLETALVRLRELGTGSFDDDTAGDSDLRKDAAGLGKAIKTRAELLIRAIERLKGSRAEDTDEEIRKIQHIVAEAVKAQSLSSLRKCVRTGVQSPLVTLHQALDSLMASLSPIFSITEVANTEVKALETLQARSLQAPVPHLIARVEAFAGVFRLLATSLERINRCLLLTDKHLSRLITSHCKLVEELDGPEEAVSGANHWAQRSVRADSESTVLEKVKQLDTLTKAVRAAVHSLQAGVEELSLNNDELEELLHQKSEEVIFLSTEIKQLNLRFRERQGELLQLRKYKAETEENSQSLAVAQVRIRDLELAASSSPQQTQTLAENPRTRSLRYLLSLLRKRRQVDLASLTQHWKCSVLSSDSDSVLQQLTAVPDTAWVTPLEGESQVKEWETADNPLSVARTALIRHSPLLQLLADPGVTCQRYLTDAQFYRCVEAIFRTKSAANALDLSNKIKPESFPSFFLRYANEVQGSKAKGERFIGSVLASLAALHIAKQPYAVFISRILCILDPHPASLDAEILGLQWFQRVMALRVVEESRYFEGGRVELGTVLEEFYSDFHEDCHLSQIWLERIKPPSQPEDHYGFSLIAWRLSVSGKSADEFISSIPTPIQRSDLQSALKDDLALALPKSVLAAVWNAVKSDPETVGEKLAEKVETAEIEGDVRVADCLLGLLDACEGKRKRVSAEVGKKTPASEFTREQLLSFLRQLDSSESQTRLLDLVEQMADVSGPEPLPLWAVIKVLAESPLTALRGKALEVESLCDELDRRSEETVFDVTHRSEVPGRRTRLVRTTEVTLRTQRTVLKPRRPS